MPNWPKKFTTLRISTVYCFLKHAGWILIYRLTEILIASALLVGMLPLVTWGVFAFFLEPPSEQVVAFLGYDLATFIWYDRVTL